MQSLNRSIKVPAAIVVLAPAVVLAAMVMHYAVNVPYGDQWELVPLIQKLHRGNLHFADLFAPHNEHRIFFPRLIMLFLASLSQWNVLAEIAANIVLALANFGMLCLMLRHTLYRERVRLAAMALTSLIVFSPNQAESWLWGWQISWFLNVFGALTAVWALAVWRAPSTWRLLVAALAVIIATFSLASGVLVSFACLPLIWNDRETRPRIAVWLFVILLLSATYVVGYHDPNLPSKTAALSEPLTFIEFFLAYAGGPIGVNLITAVLLGAAWIVTSLGLIVIARFPKPATSTLLPWSALALYGALAALSVDVSRLGSGLALAFASRYVTLSMLMLIPACVALFKIIDVGKVQQLATRGAVAVLLVITLLAGLNWIRGARYMIGLHAFLVEAQTCARVSQSSATRCLITLYPDPQVLWPRLEYIRSIHWGGQL